MSPIVLYTLGPSSAQSCVDVVIESTNLWAEITNLLCIQALRSRMLSGRASTKLQSFIWTPSSPVWFLGDVYSAPNEDFKVMAEACVGSAKWSSDVCRNFLNMKWHSLSNFGFSETAVIWSFPWQNSCDPFREVFRLQYIPKYSRDIVMLILVMWKVNWLGKESLCRDGQYGRCYCAKKLQIT